MEDQNNQNDNDNTAPDDIYADTRKRIADIDDALSSDFDWNNGELQNRMRLMNVQAKLIDALAKIEIAASIRSLVKHYEGGSN